MTLDASPLSRPLDDLTPRHSEPPRSASSVLLIAPGAKWFSTPGADRVDIERFGVARRVLMQLVDARVHRPGEGLSTRELCSAVWPGDRASLASLANRLRVAISMLRRVGLAPYLGPGHGGYRLSTDVVVVMVD